MKIINRINSKFKNKGFFYWYVREWYTKIISRFFSVFDKKFKKNIKKRILFYHIDSLNFGGTSKFLQILAKYLNKDKYEVFFMYPSFGTKKDNLYKSRLEYVQEGGVNLIPFKYEKIKSSPPCFVSGMFPNVFEIIDIYKIDLFVTAGSGHADYPFSLIKKIPILLLNIFGQPNVQKNIKCHACISEEVAKKLEPIVPKDKIEVLPVPTEGPVEGSKKAGLRLREELNIKEDDVVFGRIGRADDGIFDPIGIRAFQKLVKKYPNSHYLIMSPPPILEKIVKEDKIQNVHFIASSSEEEDVWSFHQAIDVMAHFRNDGESFGLNIVESMLCGKPIITHKSPIWNAHLEYLDSSFSRVADTNNIKQYLIFMEEFVNLKKNNKILDLGNQARMVGEELFLIGGNIKKFEGMVDGIL